MYTFVWSEDIKNDNVNLDSEVPARYYGSSNVYISDKDLKLPISKRLIKPFSIVKMC